MGETVLGPINPEQAPSVDGSPAIAAPPSKREWYWASNFRKNVAQFYDRYGEIFAEVKIGSPAGLANVRLPYAAPDLLEALDWLLGCADQVRPPGRPDSNERERWQLARAAARSAIRLAARDDGEAAKRESSPPRTDDPPVLNQEPSR